MLRFLLELLPALLLGFWGGRRYPTLSGRLAMPLVRFGVPISVMGLLLRGGLGGEMVVAAVLADDEKNHHQVFERSLWQ